jgi:protein disulfide-isomerase
VFSLSLAAEICLSGIALDRHAWAMRTLAAALIFWGAASAIAVQVGDPRASVLAELGEPQNKMAAGAREFLNYAHGRVEITNGRVSEIRGTLSKPPEPPPPADMTAARAAPPVSKVPKPVVPSNAARPRTARWHTDIAEAQAAAAKENKLILALFTGSDWCPACEQFKAEVENDEQFAGIFSGSFVFFKNDWLRNSPQSEAEKDEVGRLKRKYWIQLYPTLLVLNAEGEKLAKVEWTKVQAGSFKEAMIEAIDEARKETKGGKKVSGNWWPF